MDPDQLQIIDFKVTAASTFAAQGFAKSQIHTITSDTLLRFGIMVGERKVSIDLIVSLDTHGADHTTPKARGAYEFRYIIKVGNLHELTTMEADGETYVDFNLSVALASICYSTTRGYLIAMLQNTVFQGFVLPIVNPLLLLPDGHIKQK